MQSHVEIMWLHFLFLISYSRFLPYTINRRSTAHVTRSLYKWERRKETVIVFYSKFEKIRLFVGWYDLTVGGSGFI